MSSLLWSSVSSPCSLLPSTVRERSGDSSGKRSPTIKAQQGDTIIVELKNSFMTENVAVHWHGIRQFKKTFDKRTHTLRIPDMLEKSKALKLPGGLADEGELPEAVNSGLGLLFSSVEPVFSSFRMTKLR
ncbi:hypothetical protein F2Q68_00038050 [Brassica cretica]|uniref:Plastocyanin-like domain-containing protein n=1 Tax=Brassica cretica TaxID=69181 RepID=A0A8S9H3V0_BRACR|nr:hypothetical protein F2Q68_00038050 [Brassica cretica]